VAATAAALAAARPARAADEALPAGVAKQDAATTGKAEVAKSGFGSATKADPEKDKDATELALAAGGLFSAGNSRSLAVTGRVDYRLRRDQHQFSASAAANYGNAGKAGAAVEANVQNVQGLLRYDYYFGERWSVFLQSSARRDRFQGLDLRVNIDPGVAYYILDEKKQRLWVELGYDYQHDVRRTEALAEAQAKDGLIQPRSANRHSIRSFAGYDNKVNAAITFTTGIEHLQSVQHATMWRFNWLTGLKSQLAPSFAAATTFSLRYDHDPLPGIGQVDAVTSISLVYTAL
jgi:putative salt-induced outer membrane protein